jgi:GT2 family glycosyltransferase
MTAPLVSVLISNQNGTAWLPRCIESLLKQTLVDQMEIIVVDNVSKDDSVALSKKLLAGFPRGIVLENPKDLGFTGGNNTGARAATGEFLFITNNDVWLEPDCLEKLIAGTRAAKANASTPLVLNYGDDTFQDLGFFGFDIFGLPSQSRPETKGREVFIPGGCAYLIEREVFNRIGGFDEAFYMYAEEVDLSWRLWVSGKRAVTVPESRIHHRGAAGVNPAGGAQTVEFRTSDQKRFLTNRNTLLTILKSGHNLLLLLVPIQMMFLVAESLVAVVALRRLSYFKKACLHAFADCWHMRGHIRAERKRIAGFRQRGDLYLLRFLKLRPNRWDEIRRMFRMGMPRVDNRAIKRAE